MGRCHVETECIQSPPCGQLQPVSFPCSAPRSIAECVDDMVAYSQLNDSIIQLIKLSSNPALREAKELIARLERRQLYKHIGQTAAIDMQRHSFLKVSPAGDTCVCVCWSMYVCKCVCACVCLCTSSSSLKSDCGKLAEEILAASEDSRDLLAPDDILVHVRMWTSLTAHVTCHLSFLLLLYLDHQVVTFDYGLHDDNPIDHMRFYSKRDPDIPVKLKREQVSHMLPRYFREQHVRLYCKKLDPECHRAAWR